MKKKPLGSGKWSNPFLRTWKFELIISFILQKKKKDAELQAELHQTKGVSANFGLEDLRTLVAEAERFLKAGDQDQSYNLSLKMPSIWQQTKEELKKKFGIV